MKVVINRCFGGFNLNPKARQEYCARKGIQDIFDSEIDRADPDLVAVVESMGKASWGKYAELKIVDIPDEVKYTIEQYDGQE